jgi:SAM-dependent methyltransferase
MGLKLLLHAGCGCKANKPPYEFGAYKEVRLDCNKMLQPDIVASIVAMPMIDDASYDAIFASHVLEHLYAHEVSMALSEFARVLKPGGKILVQVPDLQAIGGRLALDQADHVLYMSAAGAITALDVLYGHQASVGGGNLFMSHKTGFTSSVMKNALQAVGFTKVEIDRDKFEIKARALKPETAHEQQKEETENSALSREDSRSGADVGGTGNGHRDVSERALREAGLPVSASAGG